MLPKDDPMPTAADVVLEEAPTGERKRKRQYPTDNQMELRRSKRSRKANQYKDFYYE